MNPTTKANPIMTTAAGCLLLATSASAIAANAGHADITTEERVRVQNYIEASDRGLFEAVQGLSDAEWHYKPGPDRWSIVEVVEHIDLIQDAVLGILAKLPTAALAPEGRDAASVDALILAKVPDRTERVKAPPQALPTGRWTPEAALAHFKESNQKILAALEASHELRARVVNHPLFGPWDGYQWILGGAGHTARHTQQILEVKSDPGFPAQ